MEKRGVSEVIITVIMVGLVLVAIGVVWVVISNILGGQIGGIDYSEKFLGIKLNVLGANCTDGTCSVLIKRDAGGESFDGLKIVFYNSDGTTKTENVSGNIEPLATVRKTISGDYFSVEKIEVSPYMLDNSGKEKVSSQSAKTESVILRTVPVAYWALDEGTGTNAYDRSGNGNDGGIYNNPLWVNGKRNSAIQFNGINQYISIPDDDSLDSFSTITLAAWVKLADNPNYPGQPGGRYASIVGKSIDDGYQLRTGGDSDAGTFRFEVKSGASFAGVGTTITYGTGTWHHVAGTYDGANVKIYIDGVLNNSTTTSDNFPNTSYAIEIVRRPNGYYFAGVIDEVRIYNRSLSSSEIQQMYSEQV